MKHALALILLFILPPSAFRLSSAQSLTLPNGLRVITRSRADTPLIAVELWVRAGARYERNGEEGAAHTLEHALFLGTANHAPGEADTRMETLGGTLSAATGPDYIRLYTAVPRAALRPALQILADVSARPTLPKAALQRERSVILDELTIHNTDSDARAIDRLYTLAFPTHPYRRTPGGTPEAVSALRRDTLAAFHSRLFRPERCTLIVVGDLTPAQAYEEAERAFGQWTAPAAALEPEPTTEHPRIVRALEDAPDGRARALIAFAAPPAQDAAMSAAALVAAELLNALIASSPQLENRGAGPKNGVRCTPRRDVSLFLLRATGPQEARDGGRKCAEALEAALKSASEQLERFAITRSQWETARARVLGRIQNDTETCMGLAAALGYADMTDGDAPDALRRRVMALTPADLRRFARTYLRADLALSLLQIPPAP